MSNSYLQFSEVLPKLSDEEAAWFPNYINGRHQGLDVEGKPADFDENGFFPDFKFAIKKTDGEWGTYAWFYADESGSVVQVGEVVQEFLRRFRPSECFMLTWAEWNGKPHVGQFDGGGLFVTASDIELFHAGEWARNRTKRFYNEGQQDPGKSTFTESRAANR